MLPCGDDDEQPTTYDSFCKLWNKILFVWLLVYASTVVANTLWNINHRKGRSVPSKNRPQGKHFTTVERANNNRWIAFDVLFL